MVKLVDTLDLDSSAKRRESSNLSICTNNARVAKLVYALDLKSNDLGHTGSTPVFRTKKSSKMELFKQIYILKFTLHKNLLSFLDKLLRVSKLKV